MNSRKAKQKEMDRLLTAYSIYQGTQKSFCELHGIKPHQLSYWRNKKGDDSKTSNSFIEIADTAIHSTQQIQIHYPNGNKLHLPINSPVQLIRTLLTHIG